MGPKHDKKRIDPNVARLINVTRMCESLHCLPSAGGLLDQDALLVEGMQIVIQADQEKARWEAEREKRKHASK